MNNMTTEKAIYQLTDLIKDRESFCHRDDFDDMFLQDIEALKIGISALEKQVPKKVKREFATMGGCITCFETTVCPTCSENFEEPWDYDFCYNCGQALDWSDENAET